MGWTTWTTRDLSPGQYPAAIVQGLWSLVVVSAAMPLLNRINYAPEHCRMGVLNPDITSRAGEHSRISL